MMPAKLRSNAYFLANWWQLNEWQDTFRNVSYVLCVPSSPARPLGVSQICDNINTWLQHQHPRIMSLLPDSYNCGLRKRRECRESFPHHRLQRKALVSDPGKHHGTCVTHVPWFMSGSLTHGGGENVPGIPGACATRNFTYLARGP